MKTLIYLLLSVSLLSSCVSGRKFEEVEKEARECNEQRDSLLHANDDIQTELNEIKTRTDKMTKEIGVLKSDTALMGSSYRLMQKQYDKINELNEQLLQKHSSLMSNNETEKKKLLDAVLTLQDDLGDKEEMLDKMQTNLQLKTDALVDREARVKELERLISEKEETTKNLKNEIAKALLSFKDKGLSVEQKGGRVYVSLEAKLLFASGSTKVGAGGQEALKQLAKAIEGQENLTILVEGHTDTDRIGPSLPYKDNWDLSVLRATSVVRILLDNSNIDPKILTAAGRSEYLPLDENDKAKNRRIEVILIPNLNELFQILEN